MDTRKWPRTMNEAFPNTYEYACSIERPYPKLSIWRRAIVIIFSVAGITMLLGAAFK